VADQKDGQETSCHERDRGHERPERQTRQPAHPMAAGTAGAVACTQADQETGYQHSAPARIDPQRRQCREQPADGGRGDQPRDEGDTPRDVAAGIDAKGERVSKP